ncbi:unnamed protein product [Closterium sp. NIES-64]|nr:unnamed protein product [Closterium sp. NIES-64]
MHVSSSSDSKGGSSNSESGSSSGSEELYEEEDEDEEEEDEEDEELEPESEDGEVARTLKRRSVRKLKKGNGKRKSERGRVKSCKPSVRRAKPHGKRHRPRFEARIVGVRSKVKRELDFYESMGLQCPSSSHDRKAADPYDALREPMDSAGKGDPMAWGSVRFGREATDPPAKHTRDHADHVKIEGATKRYEPSAAAAANDGVGGGVWANALGECGGGVEGSMWDVRESRGEGGDAKMDPATKEGRGESMGTSGVSSRPDLAGGKTVEQLMQELAQRDREIAALKARAAPPNGAAGLMRVACGAEIAAALAVNPTAPPNGAAGLMRVACGAEIAAALAVNPMRPTPSFRRSSRPSLSHPSPSSSRTLPNGAASLMRVACGAEIAAALAVNPTCRIPSFRRSSLPCLSHPSPSSSRAPPNCAAGLMRVACGAEIAAALAVNPTRRIPSFRRSSLPSLSHPSASSSRAPPNCAAGLMQPLQTVLLVSCVWHAAQR